MYAANSTVSFFEDGTSTGITTPASATGSFTYNAVASNTNGTHTVIAWGRENNVLVRLAQGEAIGTQLISQMAPLVA